MTANQTLMTIAMVLGLVIPALADQNDARLNPLFESLRASEAATEAALIERQIWVIWEEVADPEVGELMTRGALAMRRGDNDVALETLDQVVDQAPDYAEGWNRRATLHYMMDNLDASLADIEATLALEPRHFGALSGRGLVYIRKRDFRSALIAFEEALAVSPHMRGPQAHVEALRQILGIRDI